MIKMIVYRGQIHFYYSCGKETMRVPSGVKIKKSDEIKVKRALKRNELPEKYSEYEESVLEKLDEYQEAIRFYRINFNRKAEVNEVKYWNTSTSKKLQSIDLVNLMKVFYEERNEYVEKGAHSKSGLKDYKSFWNSLVDYDLEKEERLTIEDLNKDFPLKYFNFLRNKRDSSESKKYKTRGNLNGRTIRKRFDILKAFVLWLEENKKIKDVYSVIREQIRKNFNLTKEWLSPPVKRYVLNREELEKFKKLKPKTRTDKIAKDLFLVGCYTGLRFSDITSIGRRHIIQRNGKYFINKMAVKTADALSIELRNDILKIIKKYDYNLAVITNQEMNRALFELASRSRYFQKDSTEYFKEDGSPYKLYELIKTHSGRRTFVSVLVNYHVPKGNLGIGDVMKLTGHKRLDTLSKYVNATNKTWSLEEF